MKKVIDFNSIPSKMRNLPQWVLWMYEMVDGRMTKVPYQIYGNQARSNDRRTWSTFHTVVNYYNKTNTDGIGFMFSKQDNLIGIDIDDCVKDGVINDFAKEIIEMLDSYTEISVSGTGIHIIVEGKMPDGFYGTGRKNAELGLEVYCYGRYFTMSANRENDNEIEERTDEISELLDKYFVSSTLPTRVNLNDYATDSILLSNEALWEKMFNSNNGSDIAAMYNGELIINNDWSSTDMSLCNHLAFWTGKSASRMDSMFRETALMRDKWDRIHFTETGETYGERTISEAISKTTTTILDHKEDEEINYDFSFEKVNIDELEESVVLEEIKNFPLEIFPPQLETYIKLSAHAISTPIEYISISVLAVVSSLIGKNAKIQVTNEWLENAMIYATFIGSPGARKTPALRQAMLPLNAIQKQLDAQLEQDKLNYDLNIKEYEIQYNDWFKKKDKKVEDMPIEPAEPIRKQIKVNDITVETVIELMKDNSLLLERDEFAGWIKSMNQYKGGNGGERQAYLEFWNGNRTDVNRKGGKHLFVESPFISIIGGIQPDRLTDLLKDNVDDGFLERILFVYPDKFPKIRLMNEIEIPFDIKRAYLDAAEILYYNLKPRDEDYLLVKMSKEASTEFKKHYDRIYQEMENVEFNRIFEGAWVKLSAYFARFTLIIHSMKYAFNHLKQDKTTVSVETVKLAAELIEYFKGQVKRVYSFINSDDGERKCRELIDWMNKKGIKEVTKRQVQQAKVCGVKNAAMAEILLRSASKIGLGILEEKKARNGSITLTFKFQP